MYCTLARMRIPHARGPPSPHETTTFFGRAQPLPSAVPNLANPRAVRRRLPVRQSACRHAIYRTPTGSPPPRAPAPLRQPGHAHRVAWGRRHPPWSGPRPCPQHPRARRQHNIPTQRPSSRVIVSNPSTATVSLCSSWWGRKVRAPSISPHNPHAIGLIAPPLLAPLTAAAAPAHTAP